jgi:hypothetical protein
MTIELPTTEQIELMSGKDLVITYNHFASTAGQNPVKKFETRDKGIKRLTAVADALRAKGLTAPSEETVFPLIVKAPEVTEDGAATTGATTDQPAPEVVPATPKNTKKVKEVAPGTMPPLAVRLRDLINRRPVFNNAEIWAIVKAEYSLDDNKRGYVAGQRRAMAKKGE